MRKSSFSPSIYAMWLRRYWVGSVLMALLFVFIALGINSGIRTTNLALYPYDASPFITDAAMSGMMAVYVMLAAVIAAMLCFSYLQKMRAAVMLHSLPIRREGMFLSVSAAGLTLLAAPLLLAAVLFAIIQASHGVLQLGNVLLWLLVMCAVMIFAFGFASFVGMLTGNSFAQGVLSLLFINLPVIVESIFSEYCHRFLFGYTTSQLYTIYINPFYWMGEYLMQVNAALVAGEAPPVLLPVVFVVLGFAFFALGMLLYRIRKVEAAGDVIAMRVVRPIFRYGLALGSAAFFGFLFGGITGRSHSIGYELLFALPGGIIGFFIAEMFLRRTIRVFRYYKGALGFCLVYTAVLLCIFFDIGGYGRYKLDPNEVTAITVGSRYGRVEAAMRLGVLNNTQALEDLDIQDVDGYLQRLQEGARIPMPAAIAQQVLQQDYTVYTGDEVAQAVAYQNMLAEHAAFLQGSAARAEAMASSAVYTDDGQEQENGTQYYYVPVVAQLRDGKVVERMYRFALTADQLPELQQQNRLMIARNELGSLRNDLRAVTKAAFARVYYPWSDRAVAMLEQVEVTGLLQALEADVMLRSEMQHPQNGPNLVTVEFEIQRANGQYRYTTIPVVPGDANTIAWLMKHGHLGQRELDDFEEYLGLEEQDLYEKYDDFAHEYTVATAMAERT